MGLDRGQRRDPRIARFYFVIKEKDGGFTGKDPTN